MKPFFFLFLFFVNSLFEINALTDKTAYRIEQTLFWQSDVTDILTGILFLKCAYEDSLLIQSILPQGKETLTDKTEEFYLFLKLLVHFKDQVDQETKLTREIPSQCKKIVGEGSSLWAKRISFLEQHLRNRYLTEGEVISASKVNAFLKDRTHLSYAQALTYIQKQRRDESLSALSSVIESINKSLNLSILQ